MVNITNSKIGEFRVKGGYEVYIYSSTIYSNVQMIDTNSRSTNILIVEESKFHIKDNFKHSEKCDLCLNGIGNITIRKSTFNLDQNREYDSIFNVSGGANINIEDSVFKTKEATHFYISSDQYEFLTKRSIFRKGNITVFSNQSDFMEAAVDAGIIEVHSTVNIGNQNNSIKRWLGIIVGVILLFTCCVLVFKFYKRVKLKPVKRMRENDAILCCSRTADGDVADAIVQEMEEKYELKLFWKERDYKFGELIIKNVQEAAAKSCHAIVVLSMGFLDCFLCRQMLWACLIEQKRDPSFQIFIILTEKKKTLLRKIKAFLFERKSQDMYDKYYNMYDKIFAKLADNDYDYEQVLRILTNLSTIENDNEKYSLFSRIGLILSKNKCLDLNDTQLYGKLYKVIRRNEFEYRKSEQRTDFVRLHSGQVLNEIGDVNETDDNDCCESQTRKENGKWLNSFFR